MEREEQKPSVRTFLKAGWNLAQICGATLFVFSRSVGTLDDSRKLDDTLRYFQANHIQNSLPINSDNPSPLTEDAALARELEVQIEKELALE